MHSRILVPVDLGHADKLSKALDVAATLAKSEGATLVYAGVTGTEPNETARTPEAYTQKLQEFADEQARERGVTVESHAIIAHDVTVDLSKKLVRAVEETNCDMIVMASHVPGVGDHVFHSNASHVASYAPVSVYVVR